MVTPFRTLALCCLLTSSLAVGTVHAQQDEAAGAEGWDVTLARGETFDVDFTTDEGTWMSVDPSPDGAWVTFDLLGHVYRVSTRGGDAELLTREAGVSMNYHPRYSPDGSTIAFISDRAGQNNLWIMDADGSNPRSVFESDAFRAVEPVWMPNGQYILVRRSRVSGTGGGSGLYMYHRDGGEGVELVSSSDESSAAWPSVSSDGRHLYFHVYDGPGLVGRDALAGSWQLRRKDLETGEVISITAGRAAQQIRASSGGGYGPEISPDGRWLAFARRIPNGTISFKGHRFGPRNALWLRDLETGRERVIMDPITQDAAEGMKTTRIMPGYSWTADGGAIVLSQGGRIRRLDVESGEVSTIPFRARVQRTASEQSRAEFRITDEPFMARFLRWASAAGDGGAVTFQAVGRIWVQSLPDGEPRALTPEGFSEEHGFEYAPAWSPDGSWIAFTTWHETDGGHLWRVRPSGGTPERLTATPSEYTHPAWSPDGSRIVVTHGDGAAERGRGLAWTPHWRLSVVPVGGGDPQPLTIVGASGGARAQIPRASYGPDGRIFFPDGFEAEGDGPSRRGLYSVRPDGSGRTVHATLPYADEIQISPDGSWLAIQEGDNVYVAPFPYGATGGEPLDIAKGNGKVPVEQVSTEGGLFPRWRDSETLDFGSGPRFYAHRPGDGTTDTVDVSLMVARPIPSGTLALTNARLLTMEDRQVIERGTILIDGSRIACVGTCDSASADEVIDLAGATVMPGIVDMHAHHYRENRGFNPRHDFEQAVYLAYGVTANLDNSMWSQVVFPTGELIHAGAVVGPRTYSTGDPLYRGDGARQNELTSYEVVEQNVNRLADWGATGIKQYLQPRRDQRQWVSHAARARNLMVTSEGSDLAYNLGMILDGQTAFEHPMSYTPLHGDAAKMFGRTNAVYSPTFVVGGIGPWNEEYFFQETDVWRDPKLQLWMPWRQVIPQTRRRMWRPATDYSFPFVAQGMADVIAEGGGGAIGSHGQAHGIGSHWEIWMTESAMGPMGALEVATIHGARFLGADRDIGSIRAGKLADLLVLGSNPLDDVRNTTDIRYVIQGGVVRDGMTLDEVWPGAEPYGDRWWADPAMWAETDRPVGVWNQGR